MLIQIRDDALLSKYNLKPNDATLAADQHKPLYDDLIQNHRAKVIAGGGSNIARGAQVRLSTTMILHRVTATNDVVY